MLPSPFFVGQQIRVLAVPPAVTQHSPQETRALFARCVGQILRVEDIDRHGHLELNVLDDGTQAPDYCAHTIYLEPELAVPAAERQNA